MSFDDGSPRMDTDPDMDGPGKTDATKPILKDANKPSLLKNVTIKDPKSKKKGKADQKIGMSEPQLNNYETAKRIVKHCQVIKKKGINTKTLRKGHGKMFPFPGAMNMDVYKEVY